MVKSIQRIEQELAAIAKQTEALKAASCEHYQSYLRQLGQSLQRQLVAAAYQICTQAYPEAFLALAYAQRQTLQQALRQVGRQSDARLLSLVAEPMLQPAPPPDQLLQRRGRLTLTAEQLQRLRDKFFAQRSRSSPPTEVAAETVAETEPDPPPDELDEPDGLEAAVPAAEPRDVMTLSSLAGLEALALEIQEEAPAASTPEPPPPLPLDNPDRLEQWLQQVEAGIATVLQSLSSEANRQLRAAAILPQSLPPKLLDTAVQSEESSAALSKLPNLLNLLIEAEPDGDEDDKDTTVLQVTAICLRLTEMEFADAALMAARQPLRDLATQIAKLNKQYQILQRERAIAEAEAAWRASWSDD